MQIKRAALVLGIAGGGLLSGCTTNIYQVTKTENVFILPSSLGDLGNPGDEDATPDGTMSVLTRGGTNYFVLPKVPPQSSPKSREL